MVEDNRDGDSDFHTYPISNLDRFFDGDTGPRPLEEVSADLTKLVQSEDEAERNEISGRLTNDVDIIYFTLGRLPKKRNLVLSSPEKEDLLFDIDRVTKIPRKKLVDTINEQLERLYESYQAGILLGREMDAVEKLRSEVAIPEKAIQNLRNSLNFHLSNPHKDLRSHTLNLLVEYRKGLETGRHPSRSKDIDPLDGYYILGYTMGLFGDATANYDVTGFKLGAINSHVIDSASILLHVLDDAYKIAERLGLEVDCSRKAELESVLSKEQHTPDDFDVMLAAENELLAQLSAFLLSAVQGTSFEGKLSYKESGSPEKEEPKEYSRRSAPSRVFSEESFMTLNDLANKLVYAQDDNERMALAKFMNRILSETYTAMELVEAQVDELRFPYPAKGDLYSLLDKTAKGQERDAVHKFIVQSRRLYEVGGTYAELFFWKRLASSLEEELKSEFQVYGEWGDTLSIYIRQCNPESREKIEESLIAYRRSLMAPEDQNLSDKEVLSAVYSELRSKERPDLVLGYAATFFEVVITDYTNLANDVCDKWRKAAEFIGQMLGVYDGVSSLAESLDISIEDPDRAKLREAYDSDMGSVLERKIGYVANTLAASKNVLHQFGELYLKVLEKVAEEKG